MGSNFVNLPPQTIPFKKKTEKWRKAHLDWADNKSFFNYSLVRNTVIHKKINYDLLNGKLHMEDLSLIINPDDIKANYIPNKIQHYPLVNSKLEVLLGEELARNFDFKVVVTNPNAITEIENNKKKEVFQRLQEWVSKTEQSQEESQQELDQINDYYSYEWQDIKEIRGNQLLNHYVKQYNMPLMFNDGFMDALTIAEEIYQCDIEGGEPVIKRLNPLKIRAFMSGYSNHIEDSDIIVIEDYWSPSKVYDVYHDVMKESDVKKFEKELEDQYGCNSSDEMDNIDDRDGFINKGIFSDSETGESFFFDPIGGSDNIETSLLPYDLAGNVRVLKVFWKSKRRIKKVKSYDPNTGEVIYTLYDDNYTINEDNGEEETILYINQAWEGVKIGKEIYVQMQPRQVQYNTLDNPSRCHFGIVGSVYNINEAKPFSLVDRLKPFNYLYDVIHDRLNKLIARNWGTLVRFDFAKKPKGWDVEKWMYYAKTMGIAVEDSFNEGNYGAATGKLAGGLNNASTGVIPTNDGNTIQQYTNLLEYIKMEMSEIGGISKQREGQVSNRETVGGVERATLQSSHITEKYFAIHDDLKKRVLECFLETAKIALKGKSKKFSYILSDYSQRITEIEGDEFAECDYGLVVDGGTGSKILEQKLDAIAQAALQNQLLDFSTIMKLYTSASLSEKQRMVEVSEKKIKEQAQQQQQQQVQLQQQQMEMQSQQAQAQMEQQYKIAQEKNETAIQVAIINGEAEEKRFAMMNNDDEVQEDVYTEKDRRELEEKIREFDEKLKLDRDKFNLDRDKLDHDKKKAATDAELKRKQINKQSSNKK